MTTLEEATTAVRKLFSLSQREKWRPIQGFQGNYEVSSRGTVRRVCDSRTNGKAGQIIRPRLAGKGYVRVSLFSDGQHTTRYVHQIVAEAFLGPCPDGLEINHINAVKVDNRVENLEYVTRQQNIEHSVSMGLHPNGANSKCAKLTAEQIQEIRRSLALNKRGVACRLAIEFNVSQATISRIRHFNSYTQVL